MTNDELVNAFRMRLDGKTYQEIEQEMFYASDYIRGLLTDVICPRTIKYVCDKEKLNRIIKKKFGSVSKFAQCCGVSKTTIRAILKGRRVTSRVACAVCEAVGMPERELFGYE